MATGLLALLDDIAAIAKAAAASVDDVVAQSTKAGVKAAGLIIDDAAVTPTYVVGFSPEREVPIVAKIAAGSMRNKLLILLPLALLLSALAPWSITPLLMLGGAFLCYEGAEKVFEAIWPHRAHHHEDAVHAAANPKQLEDQKVRSAIQTDFILSAEIMAITLANVEESPLVLQGIVLAIVGAVITVVVYGGVALIVKADDAGMALAQREAPFLRRLGRVLVIGMPLFLRGLTVVGTAAMVWVGGGIILHGLEEFGWHAPVDLSHDAAVAVGTAFSAVRGLAEWLVEAVLAGIVGLIIGAALIPVVQFVIAPSARKVTGLIRRTPAH